MLELHPNLLWIGHALDAREPRSLFDAEIMAVVDVAYEELPAQLPRQLIYLRYPINDGGGNDLRILQTILKSTVDLLSLGIPTLIACSAGMSRSPTIATHALAIHLNQSPDAILARIAESKSLELKPELWLAVNKCYDMLTGNV